MGANIKPNFKYSSTLIFLSIVSFISGIYSIYLTHSGLFMLPITAAFLASVFTLESKRRIASVCVPTLLILIEALKCFGGEFSLAATFSVLIALIIFIGFSKGYRKEEVVFLGSAAISVLGALTIYSYLYAAGQIQEFADIPLWLKDASFISNMVQDEAIATSALLSEEAYSEMLPVMPALIAIFAFVFSGFCLKIFSHLIIKYSIDETKILSWRFIASPLFAYFYFALIIFSLFASKSNGLYASSILNLRLIFMTIFAYIGYTFVSALLVIKSKKPLRSLLIMIATIILISSLAIKILAIIGTIVSIIHSRVTNQHNKQTPANK